MRGRFADERENGDRKNGFRQAEKSQVPDHHRRDRDRKPVRAVKRLSVRVGKEGRLNSELNRRRQRRDVQPDKGRNGDVNKRVFRKTLQRSINVIAGKGANEREVEAVGAERDNAAVAEKERLNRQRDRQRDASRLRAEQNRENRSADRVSGRPAGKRNVEHHRQKGAGGGDAERGKTLLREVADDRFDRAIPNGNGRGGQNGAGRDAKIIVRNMHRRAFWLGAKEGRSCGTCAKSKRESRKKERRPETLRAGVAENGSAKNDGENVVDRALELSANLISVIIYKGSDFVNDGEARQGVFPSNDAAFWA